MLLEDNVQTLTDGQAGRTFIVGELIDDHLPTLTDGQDGITFAIEGIGGASPGGQSPRLALVAAQLLALQIIDDEDLFMFGG